MLDKASRPHGEAGATLAERVLEPLVLLPRLLLLRAGIVNDAPSVVQ